MYLEAGIYVIMGAVMGFIIGLTFNRLKTAKLIKKLGRAEFNFVQRDFRILELEEEIKNLKDSIRGYNEAKQPGEVINLTDEPKTKKARKTI
jgi:hypothetical protein